MGGIRALIGVAILIFLVMKAGKVLYNRYAIKRCTGTVEGNYVFANWSISYRQSICYPVYEYMVNGLLYLVELDKVERYETAFLRKVEIKYDPQNPAICFVDGSRGRIRSVNGERPY